MILSRSRVRTTPPDPHAHRLRANALLPLAELLRAGTRPGPLNAREVIRRRAGAGDTRVAARAPLDSMRHLFPCCASPRGGVFAEYASAHPPLRLTGSQETVSMPCERDVYTPGACESLRARARAARRRGAHESGIVTGRAMTEQERARSEAFCGHPTEASLQPRRPGRIRELYSVRG